MKMFRNLQIHQPESGFTSQLSTTQKKGVGVGVGGSGGEGVLARSRKRLRERRQNSKTEGVFSLVHV